MFENARKEIKLQMLDMKDEDRWKLKRTYNDGLKFIDCANLVEVYVEPPEPEVLYPDWSNSMSYSEDYDATLAFEWRPKEILPVSKIVTISMDGDGMFVFVAIMSDKSAWRGELEITVDNLSIALFILQTIDQP